MPLWCESCGESEQEISTAEAGLCGDCFARAAREALRDSGLFTKDPCCHPYFYKGRLVGMCLIECGVEHEHGAIKF